MTDQVRCHLPSSISVETELPRNRIALSFLLSCQHGRFLAERVQCENTHSYGSGVSSAKSSAIHSCHAPIVLLLYLFLQNQDRHYHNVPAFVKAAYKDSSLGPFSKATNTQIFGRTLMCAVETEKYYHTTLSS